MKKYILLYLMAFCGLNGENVQAQEATNHFEFDMTQKQPNYTDATGYGYDIVNAPSDKQKMYYFSVKVPDGNYKVSVTLGSKKNAATTVVRAESRRLFVEETFTKKNEFKTVEFIVNKRSPKIDNRSSVKLKPKEKSYLDWDNRLTLEINGSNPAVKSIKIEPADNQVTTIFLCGNSTVVDQNNEPYASWGQMIPRWFNTNIAISNHAESGLTAKTFLAGKRLDKILAMMKAGDWVFCEFGHNDQKEKYAGDGAWYGFVHSLKIFIDKVKAKHGNVVFLTPTQRRLWEKDNKHIRESHGDYPDAMRYVAKREKVPVIELHNMTREFFEALGFENSKKALVFYPMGTFPTQTKELADNTHFNPFGAYEVAKMVVMGMKQNGLPMVKELKDDFKDFDPKQPDDFKKFVWYNSAKTDLAKPDGN